MTIKLDLQKVPVMRGECYRNCIRVLLQNLDVAGWTLVHGIVRGNGANTGMDIGHAWLEKKYVLHGFDGGPAEGAGVWMVYDPSNDSFVPRDFYYAVADPSYLVRYETHEMAVEMLREGHEGPWDDNIANARHADD